MRRFVLVVAWFVGCGGEAGDDAASLGNVCEQSLHHQQACFGDPPSGTIPDDQCTGELACSQACALETSCEVLLNGQAPDPVGFQRWVDCSLACVDTTSGGTGTPTTPGGWTDDTGTDTSGTWSGTNTGTSTWTSGTTDAPLAVCVTYANVYCGCLGDIAADDCVEGQTEQCDWIYDLAPEFYDCVIAQSCNGDWIETCSG